MTSFNYEAVNSSGGLTQGRVEARDLREAQRELRRRGLIPVVVETSSKVARGPKVRTRPLRDRDYILAIGEFATLVEAGVSLGEAVPALAERSDGGPLADAFAEMDRQLKRGRPLTEALRSALPSLPAYVFQLVAAGVETGELGAALRDAANQMEYEDRLRQDMRTALTYPTILVVSGLAAVLFIFTAVVPRFSVMFSGRFGELPALSRVVLGMGNAVNDNLVVVVCLLAGAAGLVVLAARQPFVRLAALELGLKLPVLGPWLAQSEIARWSTMAAKLLGNRIPLMRVLELARGGLRSVTLADQMLQVERMVRTGVSLSKALADHTDLESTSVNLVRIGEHAGKLPEMLKSLAEMHDKAGRDRLKRVLLLVEPVAILLIGGIIGVFITAVILAITSVNQIPI